MKWSEGEGLEIFFQDLKVTCLRDCSSNFNPEENLYRAAGDVKGYYELRTGHISHFGQVISTFLIRVTVLKSNVLRLWIFSHEFILFVTPRELREVLAIFANKGMHATFWGLKISLKAIFCLKFAT